MKLLVLAALCCVGFVMGGSLALSRGETPPPPPYAGLGGIGDWIPGGSLFGFDDPLWDDDGNGGGGRGYGAFGWGFGGGTGRSGDRGFAPGGGFNWGYLLGGGGGFGGGGGGDNPGGGGNGPGTGGTGPIGPRGNPCPECYEESVNRDLAMPGPDPATFLHNVCTCWAPASSTTPLGALVNGKCRLMGGRTSKGYGCCKSTDACQRVAGDGYGQ